MNIINQLQNIVLNLFQHQNNYIAVSKCYKIKRLVFFLGIIMLLSSCEKFVEVGLPEGQLSSTSVFQDASTANAAVSQLYINLRTEGMVAGNSGGLSNLLANYADEIVNYGIDGNTEKYYYNNINPTDYSLSYLWNSCYNIIYNANSIIEGLENATSIAAQDKVSLQAEALFVRAYVHFYLVNLFGPVPYITTTNYQTNTTVKRSSAELINASIIADLKKAKLGLQLAYSSPDRIRPNRALIAAMLARVYLYNENWLAAEKEANYVLDSTNLYSLENDLDKVFLKNSTGTIWQLKPASEGENTLEAYNFIFTSGPPPQGAINNILLNAFETGDQRKIKWLGKVTNGSGVWYFPFKYKQNARTGTSLEYSILFRLEEQYLIRSEARTMQQNLSGAKDDINLIRNRAGLANTSANSEPNLLTEILQERRVELFSELGHRFFDLKRSGQINMALSGIKSGWNATDILWPIPENELILNPNLKPQNPGY